MLPIPNIKYNVSKKLIDNKWMVEFFRQMSYLKVNWPALNTNIEIIKFR